MVQLRCCTVRKGEVSQVMIFKKMYLFLGLMLLILVFSGCDPSATSKDDYYKSTKSTNLSQEGIERLHIGSNKYDVTKLFGKPTSIELVSEPKSEYFSYGKSKNNYDLDFRIVKNAVTSYTLYTEKYGSSKGIRVGSSKNDVIKAYGNNYYKRNDTGAKVYGYFDKVNKLNLEFSIESNEVIGIQLLAYDYSKNDNH
ncbi:hypothetical protein WKH56_08920 [Priestia sp. SB1]|uniref:Lipoprotein n=1 Tax=Priestia aryabhattai TaxID=412384 RepID=A0AAX6NDX6_PRIAR|nr:hypothetical protein [Priestia aryabhattai]MDU9693936.1 hypothetical protein [Priestia aryabhattai]NGY88768.1 hypothetical protein [Priestia megaterium]